MIIAYSHLESPSDPKGIDVVAITLTAQELSAIVGGAQVGQQVYLGNEDEPETLRETQIQIHSAAHEARRRQRDEV